MAEKPNGTPQRIEIKCGHCSHWRPIPLGPVIVVGEERGVCWAMPPQVVPFFAEDRRTIIGQAHLRPHTIPSDGCMEFFNPREDLLKPAANDPNLNG